MTVRLGYTAWCALACCCVATSAFAQADAPIRLRARTFIPVSNIRPNPVTRRAAPSVGQQASPSAAGLEARSLARAGLPNRHVIVQFSEPITGALLVQLRESGAVPLRYVPDHALALAIPETFDTSALPGARWLGALEPADRVSSETARDLAAPFPSYPLTAIEFHPDVARTTIDGVLAAAGTQAIEPPASAVNVVLVPTDAAVVQFLAEQDSVAWIYPAPPDLAATPAALCEGLVRPEGIVASFAAMGEGWDGPGRGAIGLTYFVSPASNDLPEPTQVNEIRRAMAEWSRAAAIGWEPAAAAGQPASIDILWGSEDHGDGFPFSRGVLAHAFYPSPPVPESIAGDVHFNDTLLWGANDVRRWDVFTVALHELGHSLGLVHSADPDAVMYPLYRGILPGLTAGDVEAVRSIYAAADREPPPSGWGDTAVGYAGSGGLSQQDGRFIVAAAGRDIWDRSDQFRFVSRVLRGDGDIVAHVDSLTGSHRWSKAGLMIRGTLDPDAPHAFAVVSRSKGLAFQRRPAAGGLTLHTDGGAGAAPRWLWLSRRGHRVEAYAAADEGQWQLLGADTIDLAADVLVGMAVTAHDGAGRAEAVFSNVEMSSISEQRWVDGDVGAVGKQGGLMVAGARMRVRGAGADIWDRADAFHFVWQPVDGDVDIVARLTGVQHLRSWSKAGVMIRSSLAAGAPHAFMLGSAAKGFAFQRRTSQGGWSTHSPGGAGAPAGWLKLSRRGDRITAYRSKDGIRWTMVGSEEISMGETVYVGLAVSSHTRLAAAEAVFESVRVSTVVRP